MRNGVGYPYPLGGGHLAMARQGIASGLSDVTIRKAPVSDGQPAPRPVAFLTLIDPSSDVKLAIIQASSVRRQQRLG